MRHCQTLCPRPQSRTLASLHRGVTETAWQFQQLPILVPVSMLPQLERVKAGLRNAQARESNWGQPRAEVSSAKVAALRAAGASWRTIASELGVGLGTA
jgi:hypothetical protein